MILICVGKINEIVARVEEINIDIAKVFIFMSFISILKYPKKYRNQNYGVKNQNQEFKKKLRIKN